ncbi:NDP-sugar synthase [Spirochaetota bacterium]
MKAFLMAAGFGERLKPLTETTPKPLLPVFDIPIICYSLMLLKEAGVSDVMCNLHYRHEDIINYFRKNNNFNMDIKFSFEDEILGTGGGLKKCEDYFDDDFILINSDIVTDLMLPHVIRKYESSPSAGTVVLYRAVDSIDSRTVSTQKNRVVDFKNHFNTNIDALYDYMGIAVLSPVIFKYLEEKFSKVVYTGFTGLIENHGLGFYEHRGLWRDVGTLEAYDSLYETPGEIQRALKVRLAKAGIM